MTHDELSALVERVGVEGELVRVKEAGDQNATRDECAVAFAPHRCQLRNEKGRHRVEDDVELLVVEH